MIPLPTRIILFLPLYFIFLVLLQVSANAQEIPAQIPSSADVSRVQPEQRNLSVNSSQTKKTATITNLPSTPIPEGAQSIHFVLRDVNIIGATALSPNQLRDIYAPYLNRDITLDIAYMMAGAITERYRSAGYFLSLAYVPDQKINEGLLTIKVVEGYVGKAELENGTVKSLVAQGYIQRLLRQRPLKSDEMESFLLRLNDLPGHSFKGVLSPLEGAEEGAVRLTLIEVEKEGRGSISFDNSSSRFLGPNQISASYTASFLPSQQTTLSGLTSLPTERLNYLALTHSVAIAPDITIDINASKTRAQPDFTLKPLKIESDSTFLSLDVAYQWIRQRDQNLLLKFGLDGRNSKSDLLDTAFTRDRIRAVRADLTYDVKDDWYGYNILNLTLSKGIDGLGSSKEGDIDLSRAEAKPDFTKAEFALTRLQGLSDDWSMLMAAIGQTASGALFSAEEIGYGGQSFGRAFDSSEITGDKGLAGSLELRYEGLRSWDLVDLQPYVFYDIGKVWNEDAGQIRQESGASVGLGTRVFTSFGLSGSLGLAWPLTRSIETPVYGQNEDGPRILLQVNQEF